jgi:hypothetical protein
MVFGQLIHILTDQNIQKVNVQFILQELSKQIEFDPSEHEA